MFSGLTFPTIWLHGRLSPMSLPPQSQAHDSQLLLLYCTCKAFILQVCFNINYYPTGGGDRADLQNISVNTQLLFHPSLFQCWYSLVLNEPGVSVTLKPVTAIRQEMSVPKKLCGENSMLWVSGSAGKQETRTTSTQQKNRHSGEDISDFYLRFHRWTHRHFFDVHQFFDWIFPFVISPIPMVWNSVAVQTKRLDRLGISKIEQQMTCWAGAAVTLHVIPSLGLWTIEQKVRKAALFHSLLDFCFCLKLLCVVGKKKKKSQNLFNVAVFNYSKAYFRYDFFVT